MFMAVNMGITTIILAHGRIFNKITLLSIDIYQNTRQDSDLIQPGSDAHIDLAVTAEMGRF